MENNDLYSALGLDMPEGDATEGDLSAETAAEGEKGERVADSPSGKTEIITDNTGLNDSEKEGTDKSSEKGGSDSGKEGARGSLDGNGTEGRSEKGEKGEQVADAPDGEGKTGEDGRDREKDAQFAAARRRAEADFQKKLDAQKEESENKINEILSSLHIEDPYTGKEISSVKEFEDYKNKVSEEEISTQLENSGITRDTIDKLISEHPAVKRAAEIEQKLGEEERTAKEAAISKAIEADIKAISEIDPDIRTMEDISAADTEGKILELVKKGYSLKDAYIVSNYEKISEKKETAARQSAMNEINSKTHLGRTAGGGRNTLAEVPADIRAQYLYMNPEMSDEDIQKDYNRYLKSK